MDLLSESLLGDTVTLIVLGVILLGGLLLLRIMFKLTATLFRIGCGLILFILIAVGILIYST